MKKLFTLIAAALMTLSVNAAKETYDFTAVQVAESDIVSDRYALFTWGDNVADDMQMMAYGTETFNNRFSAGPRAQNAGANANCFKLRVDEGAWKGLYSQYNNRVFAIRDLKVGDKVTITMKAEREALQFKTGTTEGQSYASVEGVTGEVAVASGTTYTVTAAGNLLLVTTGEAIIQKIEIEEAGDQGGEGGDQGGEGGDQGGEVAGDGTYDFTAVQVAESDIVSNRYVLFTWGDNVADDMQMMAYGTETFDGRFSAGPRAQNAGANANCFKLRVDAGDWKGLYSQYSDRVFAIRDLKVGDKVTITMKAEREALQFKTGTTEGQSYATVEGVTGEAAVVSGTAYTVTAAGNLLFVTTGEAIIQKIVITSAGSTTGIQNVAAATKAQDGKMYNLAGQEVGKGFKGIAIMNGRKVIVK